MYKKDFFACSSSEDDLLWIPALDRGQQTTAPSSAHHKCGLKLKEQASLITDRHDEAHIRGPLTAASLNRITSDLMKVIMMFHRTEHSMTLDCYARDFCQSVYNQIKKKKTTHKRKTKSCGSLAPAGSPENSTVKKNKKTWPMAESNCDPCSQK